MRLDVSIRFGIPLYQGAYRILRLELRIRMFSNFGEEDLRTVEVDFHQKTLGKCRNSSASRTSA